ncbi:MAG: acetylxylan esterase [Spirochaetes bacterium]|nr:acetylxylan esterase [Spirochaetota bacterium]
MKAFPIIAALLLTACILTAQEKTNGAPCTLKITADKPDAIYAINETITFTISFADTNGAQIPGKKMRAYIERETLPAQVFDIVTADEPLTITTTLDRPGFALCVIYSYEYEPGKKLPNAYAGAGVDVTNIKPGRACPPDFDEFWKSQKARLAMIPLKSTLTPVALLNASFNDKVETFDVRIDCVDNLPVSGYYSRPSNAAPKSCPALLSVQGAGVRSSSRMDNRALNGLIAMDINAHGIDNGKSADYYKEIADGRLKGYSGFSNDNRNTTYFNGMFLRVLRALEFLKTQPEWDGRTLIITGGSQGGAQSIMGAALDPDITACYAYVTAMCNHNGPLGGTKAGWPRWVPFSNGATTNTAQSDAAQYYDMCNFAARIKAKTFCNVGFIDTTCAPASVYAMYNSITAPKKMLHYIDSGHGIPRQAYSDGENDLTEYLKTVK